MYTPHSLEINDFEIKVRLGCSEQERTTPQAVRVSLNIDFSHLSQAAPQGFFTDRLEETVCYAEICETIQKRVADREYQLVEFLAQDLRGCLREVLLRKNHFVLKVHKVQPPIEGLKGGVTYTCAWDPQG